MASTNDYDWQENLSTRLGLHSSLSQASYIPQTDKSIFSLAAPLSVRHQ